MGGFNYTSIFSWTQGINWYGVFMAIVILAVGTLISGLFRKITYKVSIRFFPEPTARNVARAVYYTLLFIVGASALGALGIDLTGLLVAGGIVGIILGFALQNITANLFSGLFIYWERPFKPGDLVDVNGLMGWILDINIMSTRILGLDGVKIRLPNQEVYQSHIKNYEATNARRIDFVIGIAYKEDAEKAYKVIRKVIEEHPLVLVEPPPDIFVYELGDSSVNIMVRVWVPSKNMMWYNVYKDLLWKMKKAITEAGIEIPFIQNDIWFRTPLRIELTGNQNIQRQNK